MEAGQDDIALNIDEDDDFVVVTPVQPMESGTKIKSLNAQCRNYRIFSVAKFLCEINFVEVLTSKIALSAISGALNSVLIWFSAL